MQTAGDPARKPLCDSGSADLAPAGDEKKFEKTKKGWKVRRLEG